jgi:hypothetical protein
LDAARGQLRAAIRLWFNDGDPVAIHTLASAAHEIVHALFKKKGLKGLVFDTPYIRPASRQRWASGLKKPANFFKHAHNEDTDASYEFDPTLSIVMMAACCKGLMNIGEPISMEALALTYWTLFANPSAFGVSEEFRQHPKVQFIQKLAAKGREVYFREFEEAYRTGVLVFGATNLGTPHVWELPR